ncbi:YHYH protein [Sneathiella glossodoripedis]|uniref:YHYH protein n=1 Tax=Sneathiella glossodoripedis TaxID=418853 RepID=UPI00047244DC|nr:YHYH protein [Sneathiella glossodoripedis]
MRLFALSLICFCQPEFSYSIANPHDLRHHTETKSAQLSLREAKVLPIAVNKVDIAVKGPYRVITANGIANHLTGRFPGQGNPHAIREQSFYYKLPLKPVVSEEPRYLNLDVFGIAVNGVLFDPQAAEWYRGERHSLWQYDPLGGAVVLGLDEHHAHVQRNGTYHYHGLPTGLLQQLGFSKDMHSPLVGWAMDGHPIYALIGRLEGKLEIVKSSYQLRKGMRPGGFNAPSGPYDGAFVADWEYVRGTGNLDECNGAFTVSEEFPSGTYAYFLTETFPVVPRCLKGTVLTSGQSKVMQRPVGRPDIDGAADRLGIDVRTLKRALGPPPPYLKVAAQKLGISEDELKKALHPH